VTDAAARRREYFRANMRSRGAFWALFLGLPVAAFVGFGMGDVRLAAGAPLVVLLLVVLVAYQSASTLAKSEFFGELAPTLGLRYTIGGHYVPITPLLAAGDRQRFEHTMQGPLHGAMGGPSCLLGHYTYGLESQVDDDIKISRPHRFTVCAIDVGVPIARFRGLYLRPRVSSLGVDHDWLARAPRPERVELESVAFNEIYDLRRANDQDTLAVRELFSPSFVDRLVNHPLRPGFECKAGTLVVFIGGHADSAGKFTLLLETARDIARRLSEQVQQDAHFSAAGQTIR
jgi:hypothetical protein